MVEFSLFVMGYDTVMRNEMEAIFKETFRDLALKTRYNRGLTQAKMAEALVMSERSYEDIETGRSACGSLTTILLLMEVDDPQEVLELLRVRFEKAYEMAGVMV